MIFIHVNILGIRVIPMNSLNTYELGFTMEGGIVRVWMHGNIDRAIVNVTIRVAEVELKHDSLLFPNYANVPKVPYFMFS